MSGFWVAHAHTHSLTCRFRCFSVQCGYANSSTRLLCRSCGRLRFADVRKEKERTVMDINDEHDRLQICKLWVQPLVQKCVAT